MHILYSRISTSIYALKRIVFFAMCFLISMGSLLTANTRLIHNKLIFDNSLNVGFEINTTLEQIMVVNANLKTTTANFSKLDSSGIVTANTTIVTGTAVYTIPFFYSELASPLALPNDDTIPHPSSSGDINEIPMNMVHGSGFEDTLFTANKAGIYFLKFNASLTATMNAGQETVFANIQRNQEEDFASVFVDIAKYAYNSGTIKMQSECLMALEAGQTASVRLRFPDDIQFTVQNANFMGIFISE